MFSGIVETVGIITAVRDAQKCKYFSLSPKMDFNDIALGQSIAVNGVCLTITDFDSEYFNVTAVPETLQRTNLHQLKVGDLVNLERSLTMNTRVHGHYVQGHVDSVGKILEVTPDGDAILAKISLPEPLAKYLVTKGYVAIDGMSITVIDVNTDWFTITLIPHTRQVTIAKQYCEGTLVNLEVDIMGKYVEKLLSNYMGGGLNA